MNIEKEIIKKVIKCNREYSLFSSDERLIIAISGGKDSMSLLRVLSKIHNPCLIYPVHIYPYKDEKILKYIQDFSLNVLSIKDRVVFLENPLYKSAGKSCYICARGRRKTIFEEGEREKIYKIVVGHNKNDVAETFLMNIFYSGNTDTIRPVQDFFNGKFTVIRPFYFVEEHEINRYRGIYHIESQNYDCAGKESNKREVIRAFLKSLGDKYAVHRVFNSAVMSNA
jgi:tRNA 2-thiocytidine biosynthesis protein TtcA